MAVAKGWGFECLECDYWGGGVCWYGAPCPNKPIKPVRKECANVLDLHYLRNMEGLTMQELADKCGVTRQTIYNIEHHKHRPKPALALQLGKIFGVNWWEFLVMEVGENE